MKQISSKLLIVFLVVLFAFAVWITALEEDNLPKLICTIFTFVALFLAAVNFKGKGGEGNLRGPSNLQLVKNFLDKKIKQGESARKKKEIDTGELSRWHRGIEDGLNIIFHGEITNCNITNSLRLIKSRIMGITLYGETTDRDEIVRDVKECIGQIRQIKNDLKTYEISEKFNANDLKDYE